jgi:hypothetical protein
MTKQVKRAALYVRVSTDHQTVENQIRELSQVVERRGWEVVEIYRDAGISGAKGRDGRPGLDTMLKDASRRKFDVVMAWAIDRLGRSLVDLLGTIQGLEACSVDLYSWRSLTPRGARGPTPQIEFPVLFGKHRNPHARMLQAISSWPQRGTIPFTLISQSYPFDLDDRRLLISAAENPR